MALTFHTFKFLEKLKKNQIYFGQTLTIGRLNNLISYDDFDKLKINISNDVYADNILIKNFDLVSLNALDYSSFENADIIHDLNIPIKDYPFVSVLTPTYNRSIFIPFLKKCFLMRFL